MAKKTKNLEYYEAIGRRKEAVARARCYIVGRDKVATVKGLKIKAGDILINKKPSKTLFPSSYEQLVYLEPLTLTKNIDRFAISILVSGGGKSGQLMAVSHALARAVEKADKAMRPILKKKGLLTRDQRVKERRKVGTGGKARRQKQSPKR